MALCSEYPVAGLYLIVEVGDAQQASDPPEDLHEYAELPWIDILAISCDVPSTGEDQPSSGVCVVKHSLRRSRRVLLNAPWDQNRQYAITSCNGFLDHRAVVRRPWVYRDLPFELAELVDALLPTDGDNIIASVECMLDHVAAKLAGGSDDAHFHIQERGRITDSICQSG